MVDQRRDKWIRWIDGQIKNNVLAMHLHLDTWREVAQILEDNGPFPESYWWEFMRDTYATTQAAAVRRQCDEHPDAASLANLIAEIRDDHRGITRDWWIGLWRDIPDPFMQRLAVNQWAENFAGPDPACLNPAIPTADFDALQAAGVKVTEYVDRRVAHSHNEAVPVAVTLTLADVHQAVEEVGRLFQRYLGLLTANGMPILVPAIQHNWKAVFRQPWIRPGH